MADLDSFNIAPDYSLDSFGADTQKPPSYINEATAKSRAAYAVAIGGPENSSLGTYDTVNSELSTDNTSALYDQIKQNVAAVDQQRAKEMLPGVVEDPSIADDSKVSAVKNVLDPNSPAYSAENALSRRALQTPLVDETPEQEITRISVAATIQAINAVKKQKQALYNAFVAKNNPNIASKVGAVLGGLIPLTSGGQAASTVSQAVPDASWWDRVESFLLPGEGKQKVIDYLNELPLDQQVEATRNVLGIVKDTSGILPDSTNNANAVQTAAQLVQDGGYAGPDKVMDNVGGLLDVVALGGLVLGAASARIKVGQAARQAAEGDRIAGLWGGIGNPPGAPSGASGAASAATKESFSRDLVKTSTQPTSVAENLRDTNPQQFRLAHNVMADDATDEAAQSIYGTTRNEAVADDHSPEVAHTDGSVKNKVSEPDFTPKNALDPDIADFVNNDGFTALENSEKAKTRAKIVNNFADALTPSPRTEMWQFGGLTSEDTPEGVRISATYGPSETGYANPDEARDLFKWIYRDFGLTDDNITVLERRGSSYYPYEPETAGVQANGSGESSASVEAMNRNASEQKNGQFRFLIDKNDTVTPLQGVDSVDAVARPGQVIVQRGIGKDDWTVLSNGNDLSGDVLAGKVNRNRAKLNAAAQERLNETKATRAGDYLVQIDYDYRFKPGDVDDWYDTSVKRNFFDYVPPATNGEHGSLTQHLFPSTSVQDPIVGLSALTTSDKAAGLERAILKNLKPYSDITRKLPVDRQAKLISKLQDANLRGYEPTETNMLAEGFTNDEIEAAKSWRKYWDNIWWLDNLDHNKTAINRGHKMFVDRQNNTSLEVKPVNRRGDIAGSVDIADPRTGGLKTLTPKDIDFIYGRGGKLAQLETPIKVGDDFATHVVSMETPDNYLREINHNDIALHYRPGYFNVTYKGPYFIDRVWHDKQGNVKHKQTVYTSDNRKDADMIAARLDKSSNDGSKHFVRLDRNLNKDNYKKNTWDLYKAAGRSSQRFRGERLMDATSNVMGPGHGNLLNPIEAAVRSARSISRRASVRDWLDTTKSRFIANNSNYLPKNEFGQPAFPARKKDIAVQVGKSGNTKGLAKARAEFDYIRAMENGYINSIDDGWKATLNGIADILGEKHVTVGEKAARSLAKTGLTAHAKKVSFALFLALNPVRQLLIQSHQGILLAALNPSWFISRGAPQMVYMMGRQLGMSHDAIPDAAFRALGMSKAQADQMWKDWEKTGLGAGVDKHTLVRGSLNDMADMMIKNSAHSAMNNVLKPVKAVGHYSRVAGFDAGEWTNILSSWLGHRDKALRQGADITKSDVQANIAARARDFTGSMNAAGDMPYNANELNVLMQFQQQAHKMFAVMTTNRTLSRAERMRLLGFETIMWGIPAGLGAALYSAISSDKDSDQVAKEKAHAVELIQRGAESGILNRTASMIAGDKVDVDFSSLDPLNMYGTGQLIHSLFTQTPGTIVANTPTGSLLFGNNPRLTKFAKTTAQYFHLMDDNGEPVTFSQEAMDFARMSSGLSNAFKAAYALKYGQQISSYTGKVTDPDVTSPEALLKFFGFSTWAEAQKANENQQLYQASADLENDVNKWYTNFRSDMARADISPDELEYIKRVHNKAFQVWGNNPKVSQLVEANLLRDAAKGNLTFYKSAVGALNTMNYQDWRLLVLNTPQLSDETKQQVLAIGEIFHNGPEAEGKE